MGPESSCCLHILYQLSAVFRVIIKHFHFETDPGYCTVHVAEINDKRRKNGGRDEEIPLMRFKLSMFATFHRLLQDFRKKEKMIFSPRRQEMSNQAARCRCVKVQGGLISESHPVQFSAANAIRQCQGKKYD